MDYGRGTMKTVAVLILALSPILAFGQASFDGYMFDGYMWEEWGKEESLANLRLSLLAGFLQGFDYGYLAGYVKGMGASRRIMLGELGKASSKSKQKEAFKALVSKADDLSWPKSKKAVMDTIRIRFGPKEKVEEYSRDVDKFLKMYPLCRKQDIFTILDNMVHVWEQNDTYKRVGEKCAETE
jgi:hypothetical protein